MTRLDDEAVRRPHAPMPLVLERITPTAAECAAYFRDATEPPPRRFSKLGQQ